MPELDRYLRTLEQKNGSDLHVAAGLPPKVRIHGNLEIIDPKPMADERLRAMLYEILSEKQRARFEETGDLDLAYELTGVARYRCNFLEQLRGVAAVFRRIPTTIKTIAEIDVPPQVERFCHMRSGLVLVTGPTGSGKSTTLAAMVDYINVNYRRHIITIEDPVEFVHQNKKSILTQREVGHDTESFAAALRSAAREDPDVILVGEMRDLETIGLAITLAEMGQLVFGTLHTNNAAKTIDRIIDSFPEDQQSQVRTMLSTSLKGVVSQLLMRKKDGTGRLPVNEVLFANTALPNIIREGKIHKIVSLIEAGKGEGMQLMDNAIWARLQAGEVEGHEAYMKALDKARFEKYANGG